MEELPILVANATWTILQPHGKKQSKKERNISYRRRQRCVSPKREGHLQHTHRRSGRGQGSTQGQGGPGEALLILYLCRLGEPGLQASPRSSKHKALPRCPGQVSCEGVRLSLALLLPNSVRAWSRAARTGRRLQRRAACRPGPECRDRRGCSKEGEEQQGTDAKATVSE